MTIFVLCARYGCEQLCPQAFTKKEDAQAEMKRLIEECVNDWATFADMEMNEFDYAIDEFNGYAEDWHGERFSIEIWEIGVDGKEQV